MDEDKPFDATESYLCEDELEPSPRWRTVSLVTAMLGILQRGPGFEKATPKARREALMAAIQELSGRGLDAVSLVRYGMSMEAAVPLLGALIAGLIFGGEYAATGIDVEGWAAVLGVEPLLSNHNPPEPHEISKYIEEVIEPAVSRIFRWVTNASMAELVDLAPPASIDGINTMCEEPVDRELRKQYRWAVDHFAKTFYRDWRTNSLYYEFQWLDGEILPPCPTELMLDREIPREKITEEIARRVVYAKDDNSGTEASLVAEMSRHARELLKRGCYREAAAVLEFGIQRRSEDPEVRNNLGFCLIPVDPHEALRHLQTAAGMGYQPSATNTYNQMCCYIGIKRPRAALSIAETEWKSPNSRSGIGAVLWELSEDGSWTLFESDDPSESVAKFSMRIARDEGWAAEEKAWYDALQS